VFSVFSFQFQQNKFYPNRPIISKKRMLTNTRREDKKIVKERQKLYQKKEKNFVLTQP